jgi:hypothetical protein
MQANAQRRLADEQVELHDEEEERRVVRAIIRDQHARQVAEGLIQ